MASPQDEIGLTSPGALAKRNKRKKELAKQRKQELAMATAKEGEMLKDLSGLSLAGQGTSTKSLYEVKPAPGKGLGLFATTTIKKGTDVLCEEAIFKGAQSYWSKHAMFNVLPEDRKRAFMDLYSQCNCGKEKCIETDLMKIWEANSFEVTTIPPLPLPLGYAGPFVCIIGSRINHDCSPNTSRGFTKKCQIVFRAITDLQAGEEITTDYVGLGPLPAAARRQRLLDKYKFNCLCSACTNNVQIPMTKAFAQAELKIVSRPGLPVVGSHTDELEHSFAEVDQWYRMIDLKIQGINENTMRDLARIEPDTPLTIPSVGKEKLNRIFQYSLANDKYRIGWKTITLLVHRLERDVYAHTVKEFEFMDEMWGKYGEQLTKEHEAELKKNAAKCSGDTHLLTVYLYL